VLREQQLIVRVPGADGSMTERVQYRSASLSDPGRMEPYRLVREVVCTGACQEQEEAATQEIAQADTEPPPVESEEAPSEP
ncbi:hypothetical protein JW848_00870, partial [Candidatus Bipolaricaulota bacterium]|nr:hypothetical protein [Candidatus Bipolaricaulota bacterium]